ncbi:Translation initiation factor IF-2, putative isoform 1 [Cucumis melo var. makuwa]|uniref:Translation initiation factor IF-2, putative isoform 1 n=1 Tax=Cucumis melo var. makuwa TaxID=1194695 RepID=A0A5A7SXV4_CUCMM|nr:Translation initiation factor IF-2, putative isoform 1 [Cucumis melo var. makuwa]TYK09247.1 Translation initiation factor IF-2, putative isoform 1 [Cucumis melo var. makuwa]
MARRKAKKTVKKSSPSSGRHAKDEAADKIKTHSDEDVERHAAAIRAIRDVEIERLITELRLLRSYFNKEQLQTPLLQFFEEKLPSLSISIRGDQGEIEVQWKDTEDELHTNPADGVDIHASLLHRLSTAYPYCSAGMRSFNGFEFSSKSVKTNPFNAENLQIPNFVLEEPSDNMVLGMPDILQTPGISNQRLSIGMTPKTRRLPKPGEMLVSIHGSPLGVYKEDNMEAIHGIFI